MLYLVASTISAAILALICWGLLSPETRASLRDQWERDRGTGKYAPRVARDPLLSLSEQFGRKISREEATAGSHWSRKEGQIYLYADQTFYRYTLGGEREVVGKWPTFRGE